MCFCVEQDDDDDEVVLGRALIFKWMFTEMSVSFDIKIMKTYFCHMICNGR